MAHDEDEIMINETLINCNIEPSYILILKDEEKIPEEIWEEANRLHELNNLPIVIYNEYAISHNITQSTLGEIVEFKQLQRVNNIVSRIKELLNKFFPPRTHCQTK